MKRNKLILFIVLLLIGVFAIHGLATAVDIKESIIDPQPIRYLYADHVGGDKDFKGHGPKVTVSAQLENKGNVLLLSLYFHAIETKRDWTEARKTWQGPIWTAPPGYTIISVSPSGRSTAEYIDSNHQLDLPRVKGSSLVSKFEVMGDTRGDDIGRCYVNVYFNRIRVQYREQQLGELGGGLPPIAGAGGSKIFRFTPDPIMYLCPDHVKNGGG